MPKEPVWTCSRRTQLSLFPQHRVSVFTPHAWTLHTAAGKGTAQLMPYTVPEATTASSRDRALDSEGDYYLKDSAEDAGLVRTLTHELKDPSLQHQRKKENCTSNAQRTTPPWPALVERGLYLEVRPTEQ